MVEFRLLGPLEASGPAGAAALGGRKQRLLLAVLLVHAGEFVSREVLVDALWPAQPPPSAVPTIESYVSRLRGLLRTVGGSAAVIESGPAGYRVERDGHRIDRDEFERLAVAARIALDCGDAPQAVARATEAVALWRGPALAGLADEIALRADVAALQERRVQVLETCAEATLACGRVSDAIAQLTVEVNRHPAREHLRALLMLALYRAGRQAEALEAYQQARSYLVEELGLEPGSELRNLQARVLKHDKSLAGPDERVLDLPGSDRIAARSPAAEAARPPRRGRSAVVAAGLAAAVALAAVVMWSVGGSGDKALARVLLAPSLRLLDVSGSRTRAAAALGAIPTRIAAGSGSTWATSYDDGTLLRTDPRSLAVRQTINVGHGPTGVTVTSGDVWVADTLDGVLARVDIATSSLVQRVSVGTAPTEVAAGAGAVWVSNTGDGTVSRVDSRTGTVLNTTPVGAAPKGVAAGAGGVWVAVSGAGIVARLDPRSGRVLDRIQVGSGPAQIAVGRDGVWVGNELDSTVSLIDPGSDTVVLTRAVSGTPAALAVAGGGLWVAARDLAILTLVRASGALRVAQLPSPATTLAPASGGVLVGVRGTGADHRGGTLVVRTTSPIGQINPGSCCDLPPDVRALTYDGLVGFSKSPSTAGTSCPTSRYRFRGGRPRDACTPSSCVPDCVTGTARRCWRRT